MTRQCIYCVKEFDIKLTKGDRISHGVCARHYFKMCEDNGITDAAPPKEESCCADMSQVYDG